MPSASITEGYTFSNWGPLTTTFTAPASCATVTTNYRLGVNSPIPFFDYEIQCSTAGWGDCVPTGTASSLTISMQNPKEVYQDSYFSPGLHCPSGWATRGIAVRDANKTLSSSGILSSSTVSIPSFRPQWENPATLLMGLLEPSETLVVCCPDSMTADIAIGCYSTVSDYKITEGCERIFPNSDLGISTKTFISGNNTSKELINAVTGTYPVTTTSRTFSPSEASQLVAASILPLLSLVHHQTDLAAATASNTASPSPTNSAARVAPNTKVWGGLGGFLAIYLVASVLF